MVRPSAGSQYRVDFERRQRRNNPGGDGLAESEGIADRDYVFAD